ncbi:hypothetical protein NECID01_1824 [Nematocida sp. AWRm77]|nr:hypothetical protein NECID01_1824 [Nematocida sp. AWRm77]
MSDTPAENTQPKGFMLYTKREALRRYSAVKQEVYKRLRAEESVRAVRQKLRESKQDIIVLSTDRHSLDVPEKENVSNSSFVGISDLTLEDLLTLPPTQDRKPQQSLEDTKSSASVPISSRSKRKKKLVCDSEEESEEEQEGEKEWSVQERDRRKKNKADKSTGDRENQESESEEESNSTTEESEYSDIEDMLSSSNICLEELQEEKRKKARINRMAEEEVFVLEQPLEETDLFNTEGIDKVKPTKQFQWK